MKKLFVLVFIALLFSSCRKLHKISFMGEAQGTYYSVTYYDTENRNFQPQIDSLLKRIDKTASLWDPESLISKINRNDTSVVLDSTFITIFRKAQEVSGKTNGKFDITVGPLIRVWGFWFDDRMDVNQELIDSIMPLIGYEKVRLEDGRIIKDDPRIQLDFNAIAQGHSVDLIAEFLEDNGINRYLVDVGGEIYARGKKPYGDQWKIGIEEPAEEKYAKRKFEEIVFLEDKALATSGSYRKFYEIDGVKYSHTVDPETGYPVQHSLLSATVLAEDCITADAYATAFMVMGLDKTREFLEKNEDMEAFLIYSDEDGDMKTYKTYGMRKIMYK